MPVQNQTRAGQRTQLKVFVATGDYKGHIGLGVKYSKVVVIVTHGAITAAKLSNVLVRILGEQEWQAPYHPLQSDWLLWLCAGAPHPHHQGQ